MNWKAVADSAIGTSHLNQGIVCQDYGDYRIFDDVIVIYRCPVGSPDYTPPELIDKDFSSIDQTEVHDRFRLAVIIYQLLLGGQTPFAGKWIGAGGTPETNELIRRGLWLYAPNSLIQPVDRTIPLEIVHPEVQRCFLRCFNDGYQNPNLRPTAGDWVKALRLAINELTICGKLDSHYYSRTYGKCYWCDRSAKIGIDIFPGFVRPKQAAVVESTSQPKSPIIFLPFNPTQSNVPQQSIGIAVLWSYFLFLSIVLSLISLVSGFVIGFLVGVMGTVGCCWRLYRWFWRGKIGFSGISMVFIRIYQILMTII